MSRQVLSNVYRRFAKEAYFLGMAFDMQLPTKQKMRLRSNLVDVDHLDLSAEACAIRLHDCWSRYCRELVLASAVGNIDTTGGTHLTPSIPNVRSFTTALNYLKSNWGKRPPTFGEPRWADQGECLKAAAILKIQNYASVSAAIGSTPSPAEDLRIARNFIAHRNRRTATEIASLASKLSCPHSHPNGVLRWMPPGDMTVFGSWLKSLDTIAQSATI